MEYNKFCKTFTKKVCYSSELQNMMSIEMIKSCVTGGLHDHLCMHLQMVHTFLLLCASYNQNKTVQLNDIKGKS